jgi:hypothetical protein
MSEEKPQVSVVVHEKDGTVRSVAPANREVNLTDDVLGSIIGGMGPVAKTAPKASASSSSGLGQAGTGAGASQSTQPPSKPPSVPAPVNGAGSVAAVPASARTATPDQPSQASAPAPSGSPPPAGTAATTFGPSTTTMPDIPPRVQPPDPPAKAMPFTTPLPMSTEQVLGFSLVGKPSATPSGAPATSDDTPKTEAVQQTDGLTTGQATQYDGARRARENAEVILANVAKSYPSTRLFNVRLFWRDPDTREYRFKGRRKNVAADEIRDPYGFVEGYGKDWILAFMPADQGLLYDVAKNWSSIWFDRDGPRPDDEWVIDPPFPRGPYVEVEGMGAVGIDVLAGAMGKVLDDALTRRFPTPQSVPAAPVAPPPTYQQPPVQQVPVRDLRAEEREKSLENQIAEQRRQFDALMLKFNERDKAAAEDRMRSERETAEVRAKSEQLAAEARHNAELNALKTGFQDALGALTTKLSSIEGRVNAPPPPPAPVQQSNDIGTLLVTALPHIKDIFNSSRQVDAEASKIREQAIAEERRRDEERRQRDREEAQRMREDAKGTLDMYRELGKQSVDSARAIADITNKQNDPSPSLAVLTAMGQQQMQQAQLLGGLFKSGMFGGGAPASSTDWGQVLGNAFEMLGNVGAAFAESSAAKARHGGAPALPPGPSQPQQQQQQQQQPQPRAPSFNGMNQQQPQQPTQPVAVPRAGAEQAPPEEIHPVMALIGAVNKAVTADKLPPDKVASRLLRVLDAVDEYGTPNRRIARALKDLEDDPIEFLTDSYADVDRAYLTAIAEAFAPLLAERMTANGEEEEEDDDTNTATGGNGKPVPAPAVAPVAAASGRGGTGLPDAGGGRVTGRCGSGCRYPSRSPGPQSGTVPG